MVVSNSDIGQPPPVPTSKELLTHIFENVLKLEPDKIKVLQEEGYYKINNFKNISYDSLIHMRD